MSSLNIYQMLIDAGVPQEDISNWQSDLYVTVTSLSKEVVKQYKEAGGNSPTTFISNVDRTLTYEFPFCHTPFWEKKFRGEDV